MRISTESLARTCSRHPWWTMAVWMVLMALAVASIMALMADATNTEFTFTNNPESIRGNDLIAAAFPEERQENVEEFIIVRSHTLTVDDPDFMEFTSKIFGGLYALGDNVVENAVFYGLPTSPQFPDEMRQGFISPDRHTTFIMVTMAGTVSEANDNVGLIHSAVEDVPRTGDFEVLNTGVASLNEDFNKTAEQTLQSAELFGIPIAILILIVVFGSLLAASIPLILAAIAILLAVGITAFVGHYWQFSFFVVNMISMMGLAVGIDYALFIVSRYREERERGLERMGSIAKTGATASRAVLFSGLTVILALAGLIIVPSSLFKSLASGAIFVVAIAILITLTILPAIIYLMGNHIRSKWIHKLFGRLLPRGGGVKTANVDKKGGFWDWESRLVMRHPVISLLLAAGILIALALPALPIDRFDFGIKTGSASIDSFPPDLPAIHGFTELKKTFPFAFAPEAVVVVKGDAGSAEVSAAVNQLNAALKEEEEAFGEPTEPPEIASDNSLMVIRYPLAYEANSREATGKITELRDEIIPGIFEGTGAEVLVTGAAGENLDYYNMTDSYRPIVFAFVLGLSFILLTIVFRSLVVPTKAIIMNLLSVFASYGLLVLVFQKGYGNEIFGFSKVDTIDAWIPLFLFAVLFGLSMDYHVFLLSRIRERYMITGDNTESVAFGLRTTGGIITGAALIMVAIFGGFASGDLVMFQQMGFGMGVAVLLDATVIRSVLVPASMRLLGTWNWYLPRWLDWLPELHVEGEKGAVVS